MEPSGPPPPLPIRIPKVINLSKSNIYNMYELERSKTVSNCTKRIHDLEKEIKLLKILVQKL